MGTGVGHGSVVENEQEYSKIGKSVLCPFKDPSYGFPSPCNIATQHCIAPSDCSL